MRFDVDMLDATRCARLLTATVTPRPIAWVTSRSAGGVGNAAPFSFFNLMCSWPPIVSIGLQPRADGRPKDSLANIRETGEFVVNLVSFAQVEAMSLTCAEVAPEVDELDLMGISSVPSFHVTPVRIEAAPVAFECRSRTILDVGEGRAIVIGDIIAVHVNEAAILDIEAGKIDTPALDLVARMHGADWYLRSSALFRVARPAPSIDHNT